MNSSTNIDSTTAILLIVLVVLVIIFVGLFYAIYYFWGGPYEYLVIFLTIILFIIAAAAIWFLTRASPVVPLGGIITVVTPTGGGGGGGTGTMPVNVNDIISISSPSLAVGVIPCGNPLQSFIPLSSTSTVLNKIFKILSPVGTTGNLTYGSSVSLQNTLSGFPPTELVTGESGSTFQVLLPSTNEEISTQFIIGKAPGNTNTGTTVMYGDFITFIATNVDVLNPSKAYLMIVNTGDPIGGACGNHIDMVPASTSIPSSGIFMIN